MNILIISGGSGSEALQRGIHAFTAHHANSFNIQVLTNLYDNGKSTGAVRQVYDGKILGPSDLRKNQCLRHEIMHGKTDILKFLDNRFDSDTPLEYCISLLNKYTFKQETDLLFRTAIYSFFKEQKAKELRYVDFSIANIIYASLAHAYGDSMVEAGKVMASVLEIPENSVVVTDDFSAFLKAKTRSGYVIDDEADIVSWNADDPIVDTFLVDSVGIHTVSILGHEALVAIRRADIIICSSGTQWSSLIPTYQTENFSQCFNLSKAKKYFIMNRSQDKDMLGISGKEIIETVGKYIDFEDVTIFADSTGDPILSDGFNSIPLSTDGKKHNPELLAHAIFADYFDVNTDFDVYCFDYDDTIKNRKAPNGVFNESLVDQLNKLGKKTFIITGNSYTSFAFIEDLTGLYTTGGNVKFAGQHRIVDMTYAFTDLEVEEITRRLISLGILKFENRNNQRICIKPIAGHTRQMLTSLLELEFPDFKVEMTGKTTIDICKHGNNKSIAIRDIIANYGSNIMYFGDAMRDGGNDLPAITELAKCPKSKWLEVKGAHITSIYLIILLRELQNA